MNETDKGPCLFCDPDESAEEKEPARVVLYREPDCTTYWSRVCRRHYQEWFKHFDMPTLNRDDFQDW